jgi:hypothetical protein
MNTAPTHPLHEKHESLWWLAASPTIWAAHFLLSYITAAIWCAKFAPSAGTPGTLSPVRVAIAGYTILALVAIACVGRHGLRRHRRGTESTPHDFDTAGDRHGFLGYATVLLSALSAVAVIFAGLVVVFFEDCR